MSALIDHFATHDLARVCETIARRRQGAPHVMYAFADDHLDHLGALVEDHDLDQLSVLGAELDFLIRHFAILVEPLAVAMQCSRGATCEQTLLRRPRWACR